jgi:hypothetical protein
MTFSPERSAIGGVSTELAVSPTKGSRDLQVASNLASGWTVMVESPVYLLLACG